MFRKILLGAAAALAIASITMPAHAGAKVNGLPFNGTAMNGGVWNGGSWNGVQPNGTAQSTAGVQLLAIELPSSAQ